MYKRQAYTRCIEEADATRHEIVRDLHVLSAWGVPFPAEPKLEIRADPALAKEAAQLLPGHPVIFHLSTSPVSYTHLLLLALLDSHPELLVFPKETYLFDQSIKKAGTNDTGRLARYLLSQTEIAELNPQWSADMGSDGALGKTRLRNFNFAAFEKNFLWRSLQRCLLYTSRCV